MQDSTFSNFWADNKLTFKGLMIGFLILLMLVPFAFIMNLINERSNRKNEVVKEISGKWADEQTFTGPIIVVPYLQTSPITTMQPERKLAYFLPDQLSIQSDIEPEIRKRSMYEVAVYKTNILAEGSFSPLNNDPLVKPDAFLKTDHFLFEEAQVCIGISDFAGIENQLQLAWNDQTIDFNAGLPGTEIIKKGLSAPIKLTPNDLTQTHSFKIKMTLKGSERLNFVPVGKTTTATARSSWPHPSFDGKFLPVQKPEVSKEGFNASWRVQHLNRNYPQSWRDQYFDLSQSKFSVALLQPVDNYAQSMRSAKYAILIIALSFALYFLVEVLQKRPVHPIQYLLVGLALSIFYTLLLSISEYTAFGIAYAIAATATVILITLYSSSVFGKRSTAALLGAVLTMLYSFVYVLIQLEDSALLFGSIGLFVLMAVMMYFSRNIEWRIKNTNHLTTPGIS